MNRALLSALAVCFTVAGCDSQKPAEPAKPKTEQAVVPQSDAKPQQVVGTTQAPPPAAPRKGCGGNRCVIKVKVVDDTVKPCKFEFIPDELSVYGPNTVRWTSEGGWLFDTNGVVLPVGNNQFSTPSGAGSATYSWKDANTDKNKYKYTVNLKKGTKKCSGDPSVVNGADFEDPNYP